MVGFLLAYVTIRSRLKIPKAIHCPGFTVTSDVFQFFSLCCYPDKSLPTFSALGSAVLCYALLNRYTFLNHGLLHAVRRKNLRLQLLGHREENLSHSVLMDISSTFFIWAGNSQITRSVSLWRKMTSISVCRSSCKVPVTLVRINKLEFCRQILLHTSDIKYQEKPSSGG